MKTQTKTDKPDNTIVLPLENPDELSSLLPLMQAAQTCQFSRWGIYKQVQAGNLPVVLVGQKSVPHVRPRDLAIWLKRWMKTAKANQLQKKPARWLMDLVSQISDSDDFTQTTA